MSRKCRECLVSGRGQAHRPGCSYGPDRAEREQFIRENAVDLVRRLEEKVRRQAKSLSQANSAIRDLRGALAKSARVAASLADRIAAQAEVLARRAEKPAAAK